MNIATCCLVTATYYNRLTFVTKKTAWEHLLTWGIARTLSSPSFRMCKRANSVAGEFDIVNDDISRALGHG